MVKARSTLVVLGLLAVAWFLLPQWLDEPLTGPPRAARDDRMRGVEARCTSTKPLQNRLITMQVFLNSVPQPRARESYAGEAVHTFMAHRGDTASVACAPFPGQRTDGQLTCELKWRLVGGEPGWQPFQPPAKHSATGEPVSCTGVIP